MKAWILIVGILVIFAILFSPVLAISKLDLIALYKGESAPDMKPTVFIHDFTTRRHHHRFPGYAPGYFVP